MGHECKMAEMLHGQCGAMDTAMALMLLSLTVAVVALIIGGFIAMVRK